VVDFEQRLTMANTNKLDELPDQLVPDDVFKAELGNIGTQTLYRWERDPRMIALGFPPAIRIGPGRLARKYRSRQQLEKFKQALLRRALEARGGRASDERHAAAEG
jgi:hypothetical protein